MIVSKQASFSDPVMFLLGSRKDGAVDQRVGALIAKHASTGTPEILMVDVGYVAGSLDPIKIEADVVAYKPVLDVVVVRNVADVGSVFGNITITRNGSSSPAQPLKYGWRMRGESPRKDEAGAVTSFTPDPTKPWKLPDGFQNRFLNGSPLVGMVGVPLWAGNSVSFAGNVVTMPNAPSLVFKLNGQTVTDLVWLARGVDTVVYLQAENRFLLTWRFVFVWEARLELATLEVS
jgi:hypothetical protein